MALTKVAPYVVAVSNNVISTTIGGAGQIPSLTFDGSGVITSASNTALTVANTAITGNIISSQITNVGNYAIIGTITSNQLANTGITAGVYGGANNSASITVDAQGRVTSVANVAWTSTTITGGFSNMQVFTANGTFTVPSGITKVKTTVVGGGQGGNNLVNSYSPSIAETTGGSGGTSSFGNMVSATGGNGTSSIGVNGDLNLVGGYGSYQTNGPNGGSPGFGPGPVAQTSAASGTYGTGGGGGITNQPAKGGQGGGVAIKIISGLSSAQTITVTVGSGGAAGSNDGGGGSGRSGLVIVEY